MNTALAKLRLYVEHAIRGIKRQRIVADIFRNTSAGMIDLSIAHVIRPPRVVSNTSAGMIDLSIEVAAGLFNPDYARRA